MKTAPAVVLVAVAALSLTQCFISGIGIGGDDDDDDNVVVDAGTDARVDASSCASGSIHFRFVSTSNHAYCIGAPSTCTVEWLSIRRYYGGETLPLDNTCLGSCSSCETVGCPALCAAPAHLAATGQERTWDGAYYPVGTCGDGGTICADRACAERGRYIARMCAYRDLAATPGAFCSPTSTASCVEREFDWPPETGTAEITGVLDDGERPQCCPQGWPLDACTYADGGAGLGCHDPATGCASSTTCGEGCDFVVTGACTN